MEKEKNKLISIIDKFPKQKIAVWGDFILDEYLFGTTRRISREAPVLILSHQNQEFSLGGAGNSLLNLKALGAEPIPIGVIGADQAGKKIAQLIKKKGISIDYIFKAASFSTPMKTRILAGEENTRKQQILRIDREGKVPESAALKRNLQKALRSAKNQANALLISDYNYDVVKSDVFADIKTDYSKKQIPITLDSRFRLLSFVGTSVSTPNEPEVEQALGIDLSDRKTDLKAIGSELLRKTKAQAVLLTRGSKGMTLFQRRKPSYSIPVYGTTHIVDVTGAGDTVISVFTLALAAGATFKQATRLANFAGGIVVMKKGTAILSPQELKEAILS